MWRGVEKISLYLTWILCTLVDPTSLSLPRDVCTTCLQSNWSGQQPFLSCKQSTVNQRFDRFVSSRPRVWPGSVGPSHDLSLVCSLLSNDLQFCSMPFKRQRLMTSRLTPYPPYDDVIRLCAARWDSCPHMWTVRKHVVCLTVFTGKTKRCNVYSYCDVYFVWAMRMACC